MSMPAANFEAYSLAIERVIQRGKQVLEAAASSDQESKTFALNTLTRAVDELESQTLIMAASSGEEAEFLRGAADVRSGSILFQAAQTLETGSKAGLEELLGDLQAEKSEAQAGVLRLLFFEADLLEPPPESATDDEALLVFKTRGARTLDNMVAEASDVISAAMSKFKDKFGDFVSEVGELSKSFAAGGSGIVQKAVQKVVSGLKVLASYLNSPKLGEAIDYLKQALTNVDLAHILSFAFWL